jgi:predicted esterase
MTKENRKLHIKNSLQYLNLVIQASNEPEVLLGFSQGAEMASRLSMLAKAKALVLCGGRLAPELMNEESLEILHQKKIIKVQGLRDSIYSIAQHDKDCQDYHSKGLDLEVITFDGTHEIPKKVIADLIKKTRPCL